MNFGKKCKNDAIKFPTVISNDPGSKLVTLNQVIDEVNC